MVSQSWTTVALLLVPAATWNTDVHNQIGFMAETFLTPSTLKALQPFIATQYNGSIGRAAAWADGYAHTPEGRFSYQWHWIDTHDAPPYHCHLDYAGDCATGGCVVSAIANQTRILQNCVRNARAIGLDHDQAMGNKTCEEALKWVTHFIGDIAQPLHASGRAAGGNLFKVHWGNVSTELHAIWDGFIPYYAANVSQPFSNQTIAPFSKHLLTRIRRDLFWEAPYMWTSCTDPNTPEECATSWAKESNRWTCDYVYRGLNQTTDLASGGYAVGAVPIVELQIAKAALRLGTWLNNIVDGLQSKDVAGGVREQAQIVLGTHHDMN